MIGKKYINKTRNCSDLSQHLVAEGGCTRRVSLTKLRLQSLIYKNKNIREEFTTRIFQKNLQQEFTRNYGKRTKNEMKNFNTTTASKTNLQQI